MKKRKLKKMLEEVMERHASLDEVSKNVEPAPTSASLHALALASAYMAGEHCDHVKVREAIARAREGVKGVGFSLNGEAKWMDQGSSASLGILGLTLGLECRDGVLEITVGVKHDIAGVQAGAAVPAAEGRAEAAGVGRGAEPLGDGSAEGPRPAPDDQGAGGPRAAEHLGSLTLKEFMEAE